MIQTTDLRPPQTSATTASARQDASDPLVWGKWIGRRNYSLEVVQHPLRARMCGFGDKDRRPLAPAAVAKMIVKREDDSIVDVDEVDCSFFLVTVDLWSADGKQEMNLVLHPSSTERYVPASTTTKTKRRGRGSSPPSQFQTGNSTPSLSAHAPYANQTYYPPQTGGSEATYPPGAPYGPPPPPDPSSTWGYSPPVDRSAGFPPPILPSIHSFGRSTSSSSNNWQSETAEPEILPYRAWSSEAAYAPVDHNVDPSLRAQSSNATETANNGSSGGQWSQTNSYNTSGAAPSNTAEGDQNTNIYGQAYHQGQPPAFAHYPQHVPGSPGPSHAGIAGPPPRHTYTRTLVGPLSSNACRLLDEHRKPGIFFLFQDLSVRTEGTFRLRMRLMNVGAPPAPELGAQRVHNDMSPVLAQIFTEPFTVFSAKRFPGVPDTTALSIAFGNQGQKLPLRNRHGSNKRRRRGDSESDDDSE